MMVLKPGVKLDGLEPQTVLGMMIVWSVFAIRGALCTITSCNDGKHSTNSWHYKGRAFDVRTKDYGGDKAVLFADIKRALGENYDVVFEDIGGINEHIHVEYDPKG